MSIKVETGYTIMSSFKDGRLYVNGVLVPAHPGEEFATSDPDMHPALERLLRALRSHWEAVGFSDWDVCSAVETAARNGCPILRDAIDERAGTKAVEAVAQWDQDSGNRALAETDPVSRCAEALLTAWTRDCGMNISSANAASLAALARKTAMALHGKDGGK